MPEKRESFFFLFFSHLFHMSLCFDLQLVSLHDSAVKSSPVSLAEGFG